MKLRKNKILTGFITCTILISMTGISNAAMFQKKHDEIIGRDRYETASLVARRLGKYNKVILVNGMADGLSAASLAGRVNATIIPVKTNAIPESSKPIINKAHEVYIIGGYNAISKQVENELRASKIVRISGKDRCETSIKVAKYVGLYNRAYLVNGYRGEADAMSVSAVSARDRAPIILTNGKTSSLRNDPTVRYIVVGGRAVVSNELQQKYNATRLGGANRYETNRSVINTYYRKGYLRYFCNGETLVDALSASYLARHDGIVLVNNKENHDLVKDMKTVQVGGPKFNIYFSDMNDNHDPSAPDFSAHVTRKSNEYGEMFTEFKMDRASVDKDGDSIKYEWKDRVTGDYYGAGPRTVYVRAVDSQGGYSQWVAVNFKVESSNPSAPEVGVVTSRTTDENHRFKTDIMLTKDSYDSDADFVRYEWKGRTLDDYYPAGDNEVKVRAIDKTGAMSRWVTVNFNIPDNRPTKPEIAVKHYRDNKTEENKKLFKADVYMIKESTDADNDPIEYVWENKIPNGFYEPNLNQTVRVKAVDSTGSESEWAEVDFNIPDNSPEVPELQGTKTRDVRVKDGKREFKVNINKLKECIDPEGDAVRYEWQGKAEDDYYESNINHTVKLRAIDATGSASEWGEYTFKVEDSIPTKPTININKTRTVKTSGDREFKVNIGIGKPSIDTENDKIRYEWQGKKEYYAPNVDHKVKVRAIDATDAKSDWVEMTFRVDDNKPSKPELTAIQTRQMTLQDAVRKFKVNVNKTKDSTDAENDAITYEWDNKTSLYESNKEHTVKLRAVDATGSKSDWAICKFTVADTAPTKPTLTSIPTRETKTDKDGVRKFVVNLENREDSTDAENDAITYEWDNRHVEGLYKSKEEQIVKVRAVDATGAKSDWAEAKFTISDEAPPKPEIDVVKTRELNVLEGKRMFNVNIDLHQEVTDPDGDAVTYIWEGKETSYESNKDHIVKVKSVDATGAESDWAEVTVNVADTAPSKPVAKITPTRTARLQGVKEFAVNATIEQQSTDAENDAITYEWEGKQEYYSVGNHVIKVRAVDATGLKSDWVEYPFEITDTAPTAPEFTVDTSKRQVSNGKLLGTPQITKESVDADGDTVTYEWEGKASDNFYTPNQEQTIRVRAVDATGRTSDWVERKFTIVNRPPTAPTIIKNPKEGVIMPGTKITIKGSGSTDPDGDEVRYVWEGRENAETAIYSLGKHLIKVKAVDALGAESKPAAVMFFVVDPNGAGGMVLTGPTSVIHEQGVEGATITKYTFNVPEVSGHYGNDYGLITGRLKGTTRWEQIDKKTTSNGIKMNGTLPEGKYDQLKFTYYTDHDCMYNKSNITYTVEYRFNFDDLQ